LLDEQGRSDAAIECLRTALRVTPDYADAMFNLALLLQRTNQYAEAAGYWRRYLASDCQSEWAARARRSLKFCEIQINLIASARRGERPVTNAESASGLLRERTSFLLKMLETANAVVNTTAYRAKP
jgi:tetratricopeptide (TPR) repeat protein